MINCRQICSLHLAALAVLMFLMSAGGYASDADDPSQLKDRSERTVLVNDGKAEVILVRPHDAPEDIVRAVDEFQKCIREITGVTLMVKAPEEINDNGGLIRIHIGSNKSVSGRLADLKQCEVDGSWIQMITPQDLVIAGATPMGTEYGVYGFLQDYCGVRWYLPGENGRYTPKSKTLSIPSGLRRLNNPFFKC